MAATLSGESKENSKDAVLFYDGESFRLEFISSSANGLRVTGGKSEKFYSFIKVKEIEEEAAAEAKRRSEGGEPMDIDDPDSSSSSSTSD